MAVISSLLSRFAAREPGSKAARKAAADLEALRQRMTPPESPGTPAVTLQARPYERSLILPMRESAPSMASLPWQGEVTDPEWKPVVLSEFEMSIPAIPSIDELAEEGGIPPTEPRFPFDT